MHKKFFQRAILLICSVLLIPAAFDNPILAAGSDDLDTLVAARGRYVRHREDYCGGSFVRGHQWSTKGSGSFEGSVYADAKSSDACPVCQLDRQIVAARAARASTVARAKLEEEKLKLEIEALRRKLQ